MSTPRAFMLVAGPAIALFATSTAGFMLASRPSPTSTCDASVVSTSRTDPTAGVATGVTLDELTGLWARWDSPRDGERTRFWYFHGDGHGLYRYGRVGLVNTHSFDYELDPEVPGTLRLRYRKTGREHVLEAVVSTREDGRRTLRLLGDPEDPGAEYVLVGGRIESEPASLALALEGHVAAPVEERDATERDGAVADTSAAVVADHEGTMARGGQGLGDRLWIDWQSHAAGGGSFRMYQLAATAIDGRGVGWFHEGDFDDWSTEAFDYRVLATAQRTSLVQVEPAAGIVGELQMKFRLRGEESSTSFVLREAPATSAEPPRRTLELADDPRDYWSSHVYLDGGPSFSASGAFDAITSVARRRR